MSQLTEITCGISLHGGMFPVWREMLQRQHSTQLQDTEVIQFYGGYNCKIKRVSVTKKRTAKALDRERYTDIYVVAKDFSWTYVHTHEPDLGPYFCVLGKETDIL